MARNVPDRNSPSTVLGAVHDASRRLRRCRHATSWTAPARGAHFRSRPGHPVITDRLLLVVLVFRDNWRNTEHGTATLLRSFMCRWSKPLFGLDGVDGPC